MELEFSLHFSAPDMIYYRNMMGSHNIYSTMKGKVAMRAIGLVSSCEDMAQFITSAIVGMSDVEYSAGAAIDEGMWAQIKDSFECRYVKNEYLIKCKRPVDNGRAIGNELRLWLDPDKVIEGNSGGT